MWQDDDVQTSILKGLVEPMVKDAPWAVFVEGAKRGSVEICKVALKYMGDEKDMTVKNWDLMEMNGMQVCPPYRSYGTTERP